MRTPIVNRISLVSIGTGLMTTEWAKWFERKFNRPKNPAEPITLGASPYTYEAKEDCTLLISGGTVSLIEYGRGDSYYAVTDRIIPLYEGDKVRITYTVAPLVVLLNG